MKKHALLIGLCLLLVLVFLGNAARFYQIGFIQSLDAQLYDYRLRLTAPQTRDDRIVILDIDEKSLKAEGRWPWSRDKLATLMDQLFDHYGIAVVGFDIVFAEKDDSSALKTLQELGRNQLRNLPQYRQALEQIRPQLEYDRLFAERMRNRNVVLGYYMNNSTPGTQKNISGALPAPVFAPGTFKGRPISFVRWDSYGANLPELQKAARSGGHFNPIVDKDGRVRRVPMVVELNGAYYEALSLAMVRTVLGMPSLLPGYVSSGNQDYAGLEWLELRLPERHADGTTTDATLRIPVDQDVSALIPYRGAQGRFRYVSLSDVLHGREAVATLKDRIVLVGTTAPGLMDMRSTPVDEVYPGVEIHANMISGMLDQNLKQRPPYVLGADIVTILLLGLMLSLLLPLLGPAKSTLLTVAALLVTVSANVAAWQHGNLALPLAGSLLLIIALFALVMSYGYFIETRIKRQITNLFGQYVPSELVDEMSENPEQVSMAGDSREMTILFSDVRGFTTISEKLDPKELAELMNEFLTPLTRVVYKHRGTIDKYMGDCIMAFWGAPLPDASHARNAILAGIEMQQTLSGLQPHFRERGWPEIHVGVGINTGRVTVGNMGSELRVAYTVMGDAVNLASRLEGITKQYGVGIIVGENTRDAVPDLVYRELDLVRVKGKDQPIRIYEPLGAQGQVAPAMLDELKLFHQALRAYRKQEWDQAELDLFNLQRMSPQTRLYGVYAERIAYFRQQPPGESWDGVFVFQTK
ncbi:MAG TPA: adenylate/guanylate cyclase domain-containing protein [Gallionellaceae bacterium]|nr:adenylate/guanylate cyclase domain-containing protein [Gallionellaceae bacterium]